MPDLNYRARSLIRYYQKRGQRGDHEARRDWLYGPALIPGGAWDYDEQLDLVIRRAKDIGAEMDPPFELVYVYNRPPVWTGNPSDYIRNVAHREELKREQTAQERLARCAPPGTFNHSLALATASSIRAARAMVNTMIPPGAELTDPVLARIDAVPGMANGTASPSP